MARPSDPNLTEQILAAARDMLASQGGKVQMRALAAKVGTTTPTIYTRFKTKEHLLAALKNDASRRLKETMSKETTFRDACRAYLSFAENNPYEYGLLFGSRSQRRTTESDLEALLAQLGNRIARDSGLAPDLARERAFQVWLVLHGASTTRLADKKASAWWPRVQAACIDACEALIATRGRK